MHPFRNIRRGRNLPRCVRLVMTPNTCALIALLCLGSAADAGDQRAGGGDARLSMPYTGTATMDDDGTINLHLRLSDDGKQVNDTLTYKVGDRAYDGIVRRLHGLQPGQTKSFTPWKD